MKIRTTFVTNSSSSSFVCFGVGTHDIIISPEKKRELVLEYFGDSTWHAEDKEKVKAMSEEEFLEWFESGEASDIQAEFYDGGNIRRGGPREYHEDDWTGITIGALEKNFPDAKISNIRMIAAEQLNKRFGSNIRPDQIMYIEEGWYAG